MQAMNPEFRPAQSPRREMFLELDAREVVVGPLQEGVRLVLGEKGGTIRRRGLLGALWGPNERQFNYDDVAVASDGASVQLGEEEGAVSLAGSGATLLARVADLLGAEPAQGLFAAPATGRTPMGIRVRGMALGSRKGLMVVPQGAWGRLPGTTVQMPVDRIGWAASKPGGLQVYAVDADGPFIRLSTTAEQFCESFALWMGHRAVVAAPSDSDVMSCLWLDDHGVLSRGLVHLEPADLRLESTTGPARSRQVPSNAVSVDQPAASSSCSRRVRVRILGFPHSLWMATEAAAARLLSHLDATRGLAWPGSFDLVPWKRVVGTWAALRIWIPGERELVVPDATVSATDAGLCVEANSAAVASAFPPGTHVRVEVLSDRAGLGFAATSARLAGSADTPSDQLLLVPSGEGPTPRSGRRSLFRAPAIEELAVVVTDPEQQVAWTGRLQDLSANGAGVSLDVGPGQVRSGVPVIAAILLGSGRRLRVRCETRHIRAGEPGTQRVGLRFLAPNERLKSHFQRESLRLQRQAARTDE